jgi:hypothetical protein
MHSLNSMFRCMWVEFGEYIFRYLLPINRAAQIHFACITSYNVSDLIAQFDLLFIFICIVENCTFLKYKVLEKALSCQAFCSFVRLSAGNLKSNFVFCLWYRTVIDLKWYSLPKFRSLIDFKLNKKIKYAVMKGIIHFFTRITVLPGL